MSPRLLPLLALAALAASCDRRSPLEESPEADLHQEIRELRAAGFLREPVEPVYPEHTPDFFARLDELDAWLDGPGEWGEPLPDWLDNRKRTTLARRLEPFEPFFEQVTALLAEPYCAQALANGESFAYRTSIRAQTTDYDVYATPSIDRAGRWIDLLCADAVLRVGLGEGSPRTIRSLAQALDLLRLLDDGTLIGTQKVAELELGVLLSVRKVAPGPRVDPVLMRSEIERRLGVLGSELRVWSALKDEVSHRVEIAEVLLRESGRPDEDHWLGELDCSRSRLVKRTLDVTYVQDELRSASVLCARLDAFPDSYALRHLVDAVEVLHTLDVYAQLARIALSINEYRSEEGEFPQYYSDTWESFENGMPIAPCRGQRIVYDRGYNWVNLRSISRTGKLPSEDDTLLVWSWGETILDQFKERDDPGSIVLRDR